MSKKLQILDDIIEIENETELKYKQIIQNEVTSKINNKYGEEGVIVCNTYYSDEDETSEKEDCDDCAEKAHRMIEAINAASIISDCITNEHTKQIYNKYKNIISSKINFDFEENFDDNMKRDLILLHVLNHFKQEKQNENNRQNYN